MRNDSPETDLFNSMAFHKVLKGKGEDIGSLHCFTWSASLEVSPSIPMLVSPFSVGCEYSTPEHCMDRRVGNCTAVLAWQVTNTPSLILLCPLFPQHWLNSRMKWREAHAAHRHSLTSLQSSSELKHGINQLFAIKHNWFKTVTLSLHRLWYY